MRHTVHPKVQQSLRSKPGFQSFLGRYGGKWDVRFDELAGTPLWVRGSGIPLIADEQSATRADVMDVSRRFVDSNRQLFKIASRELAPAAAEHFGNIWVVNFRRVWRGLPMVRSNVELVYKMGRLVYFKGESIPGEVESPDWILSGDDAAAAAESYLGVPPVDKEGRNKWRRVVFPQRLNDRIRLLLAYEVTIERPGSHGTRGMAAHCTIDGRTGKPLEAYDLVRSAFSGKVESRVDERTVGSPIVRVPNAENTVTVVDSTQTPLQTMTDGSGNWVIPGQGAGTVTIQLSGAHVTVTNSAGSGMVITHAVTAGVPSNDAFLAAADEELAQTDTYRAIEQTNGMLRSVFTTDPWLANGLLAAVVNYSTDECNAQFWPPAKITLRPRGSRCNNMGRIFDVAAHEYGHAADYHLPGGLQDRGLSEFIGDLMAFVQTDDPRIAPGFRQSGQEVRNVETTRYQCYDPRSFDEHNEGLMLGSVVWDIHEDLEAAGVTGQALVALMLEPIALAQTREDWYNGLLIADDDDGDLANGTPHGCIDGDGYAEILTGPGPGPGFAPQVRGFDYDNGSYCGKWSCASPMGNVSFDAYQNPKHYGVNVAAGDLTGDGLSEIVTGRGAGPDQAPEVKAWTAPPVSFIGSPQLPGKWPPNGGANVGTGDVEGAGVDRLLVGVGKSSSSWAYVKGFRLAGSQFQAIAGLDFLPYGATQLAGVHVASVPADEMFGFQAGRLEVMAADEQLSQLRDLIADLPDSTTIDYSLDPNAQMDINVWEADTYKTTALADIDGVLADLSNTASPAIVASLQDARLAVESGLLNDAARRAVLQAIDGLVARYGSVPSGAVVARLTADGAGSVTRLATSPVVDNTAYVVKQAIPRCRYCQPVAIISKMDIASLRVVGSETLPGIVNDLAISIPLGSLYAIRSYETPSCPKPPPPPLLHCRNMRIIKHGVLDPLPGTEDSQELTHTTLEDPKVLLLTPTLQNATVPAKAYVSYVSGWVSTALCPWGGVQGDLAVVEDLTLVPNSPVLYLHHSTPSYKDLVASPVPADPRIFAAYGCGIDIIDSSTDTVQELAIPSIEAEHLRAAEIAPGVYRLFALGNGILTAYDPVAGSVTAQVPAIGASTMDILSDASELVLLVNRQLELRDSLSLQLDRTLSIGQAGSDAVDLAMAPDGATVLVADYGANVVEAVRLHQPLLSDQTANIATVVGALPEGAFVQGAAFRGAGRPVAAYEQRSYRGSDEAEDDNGDDDDDDGTPRAKLLKELGKVRHDILEAQDENNEPHKRDNHLDKAIKRLRKKVLRRMDGFYGGNPDDDWIVDEQAQRLVVPQVERLIASLEAAITPPAGAPPAL